MNWNFESNIFENLNIDVEICSICRDKSGKNFEFFKNFEMSYYPDYMGSIISGNYNLDIFINFNFS